MLVNKSLPYRQPHDFQIEPDGPMLNVIQVELNSFFKRGAATPQASSALKPITNASVLMSANPLPTAQTP